MLDAFVLESLEQTKRLLLEQQIDLAKRLREIDKLMPRKRTTEDYTIIKQKRKKEGFVYCVRYYVNGKVLPTKFSLKTTDKAEAETRAVDWRDDLLQTYGIREKRGNAFYNQLSGYYAEGSKLLAESLQTNRQVSKKLIKNYHNFINNYFIPFLKQEGIRKAEDLKPEKILKFGGWLRETKNLTAKTINDRINGAVKQAMDFLYLKEKIRYNPFRQGVNTNIKAMKGEVKRRRIYPINRLFNVLSDFHIWTLCKRKEDLLEPLPLKPEKQIKIKKWLLCLIATTTGLRAGEIYMLRKSSIEKIGGVYFLKIDNSRVDLENSGLKTENAYRRVPLHKFVYNAIQDYISLMDIKGDYLFYSGNRKTQNGTIFIEAYIECGIHCGYTEEEIKAGNVDFHSFRHFYRTILSNGGISKELTAYFMGHAKNMNDMEDRYNNIEEIGNDIGDRKLLAENGKKVIDTIDKYFAPVPMPMRNDVPGIDTTKITRLEPKEVEITNHWKSKIVYWTWVVKGFEDFADYEDDTNENEE